jgi:parvulin-like peptidyl-prolyl isomerase
VSLPVRTAFGYHIIKVIDKKIGHPLEFDEVEPRVRDAVQKELVRALADELKPKYQIKIN